MPSKLPTQQEVKVLGDKALAELMKPKEEGGWGMTEAEAQELIKDSGIYATTTVWATDNAPHHKEGEEVFCSKLVGDKMIAQGWATDKKPVGKKDKATQVV